jgi:hypothetical protein
MRSTVSLPHRQTARRRLTEPRYICRSHWRDKHRNRCDAPPVDAEILEAMFAASLPQLLPPPPQELAVTREPFDGHWQQAPERQKLIEAARSGRETDLDQMIERMVSRVAPRHPHPPATRRKPQAVPPAKPRGTTARVG